MMGIKLPPLPQLSQGSRGHAGVSHVTWTGTRIPVSYLLVLTLIFLLRLPLLQLPLLRLFRNQLYNILSPSCYCRYLCCQSTKTSANPPLPRLLQRWLLVIFWISQRMEIVLCATRKLVPGRNALALALALVPLSQNLPRTKSQTPQRLSAILKVKLLKA